MTDIASEAAPAAPIDLHDQLIPAQFMHERIEHLLRLQNFATGKALIEEGMSVDKVKALLRSGHQAFVAELQREAEMHAFTHSIECNGSCEHEPAPAGEDFTPGVYL